jgi:hypothetical protein
MKPNNKTLSIVPLILLATPLLAMADEADLPSPSEVNPILLFNLFTIALTPVIMEGIKWLGHKYAPWAPKLSIPLLAPLAGALIAYVFAVAGADITTGWGAAIYGAVGVWFRELVVHLRTISPVGGETPKSGGAEGAVATVLLATTLIGAPMLTTGCAGFERATYVSLKVTDATAEEALRGWNEWIGMQRSLILADYALAETLTGDERKAAIDRGNERQQHWAYVESRQVMPAVDEYNRSIFALQAAVAAYYDAKPDGKPSQGARDALLAARAAFESASRAVVLIVNQYVPKARSL